MFLVLGYSPATKRVATTVFSKVNNAFLSEKAMSNLSDPSKRWSTSTIILAGTLAMKLISAGIGICFLAIRALSVVVAVKEPSLASKCIAVRIGLCSLVEAANAV